MRRVTRTPRYIKQISLLVAALLYYGYFSLAAVSKSSPVPQNTTLKPFATISAQTATESASYRIIRVIDGDTVTISKHDTVETVRLIGIDTPEVVDPRKPVQCYGKEAFEKAKEVLTGKTVILTSDTTQGELDKYKRLLRYVYLEDGTNFNEYMIREGYAHEYTYQSNPYAFQKEFKAAETYAREHKKGLWADGVCN